MPVVVPAAKPDSSDAHKEALSQPKTSGTPQKALRVKTTPQTYTPKKIQRRSSKPIINWLQRKLGGNSRAKRTELARQISNGKSGAIPLKPSSRLATSPLPSPGPSSSKRSAQRRAISLNGEDGYVSRHSSLSDDEDDAESRWSPSVAAEADEDASMRPLPPSSPPSPSPSRSSSSYMSNPRTFRSIAASTKPTTLLSVDLGANQMAHIAQAQVHPNRLHARTPSIVTNGNIISSGASITFSALPPSPQSSSRPSSATGVGAVQAPLHTAHHPRNNPRPASPPLDNASILTLASSAFNTNGGRHGAMTPGWSSIAHSMMSPSDSISHFGGSMLDGEDASQYVTGDDVLDERDVDASVRALRPRSSRGSWESEASDWSARDQLNSPSLARTRSVWTTNSVRTGEQADEGTDNADTKPSSLVEEDSAVLSTKSTQRDQNSPVIEEPRKAKTSTDTATLDPPEQPSTLTVRPSDVVKSEGETETASEKPEGALDQITAVVPPVV